MIPECVAANLRVKVGQDAGAYCTAPVQAAEARLVLAGGRQAWAHRVMRRELDAGRGASSVYLQAACLQRDAQANMAEARSALAWFAAMGIQDAPRGPAAHAQRLMVEAALWRARKDDQWPVAL